MKDELTFSSVRRDVDISGFFRNLEILLMTGKTFAFRSSSISPLLDPTPAVPPLPPFVGAFVGVFVERRVDCRVFTAADCIFEIAWEVVMAPTTI